MTNPTDCAFPADNKTHTDGGLTKREYFAVMAMQGILANAKVYRDSNLPSVCEQSVYQADALIAELNK